MKLIEFIRLILKHKILLAVVPLLMGVLVVVLTTNPTRDYYSQTVLYTGIASGSSIEMEKSLDYFSSNIAFDNLINIINSRDTKEEVAVRLLSQHLLLDGPSDKFISQEAYEELKELVPEEIYDYVVKSSNETSLNVIPTDSLKARIIPEGISINDYEQTVENLMGLMKSNSKNFVYELLNYEQPFYSLDAISKVKAERVSSSDLIKISYETEDPGICQQTLAIFNKVCIRKYKDLKENGSDQVVKYFEAQLQESEVKLKVIEKELLEYNQENNIINYYEQSKAVANVREDMEVAYKNKKAELAGSQASKAKLEQKLELQALVQEKSDQILKDRARLGQLKYQVVMADAKSDGSEEAVTNIQSMQNEVDELEKTIENSINELYTYQNSSDGVPLSKMLPEYIDRVVETEDLTAEVELMTAQSKEFQKEVEKYAPAGANIKRIEREINVVEEEYLEILRGLNLAKLKFQDTQLSGNLKLVDPPYFPLTPIPSKRRIIIIAVVLFSFMILLGCILFMDFFDETLKNSIKAQEKVGVPALGMMPKIFKSKGVININRIQKRLMEFTMQNLGFALESVNDNRPNIITVISTRTNEGKTTVTSNIARQLKESGHSVLALSPSFEKDPGTTKTKFPWIYRVLGYQDPRNDYDQEFLQPISTYLNADDYSTYSIGKNYHLTKTHLDLDVEKKVLLSHDPDYIVIEIPNILDVTYPVELIQNSDLVVLVCRSNRIWTDADQNVFQQIKDHAPSKTQFFINGVEVREVETILGEIPRQRSDSRKKIKEILQFQFYSKGTI